MKIFTPKFSLKAEADFLNKIGMYLSAHLPLSEALEIVGEQERSKKKKETFALWRVDIENGKTLAQAFDNEAGMKISRLSSHSVALGERSASLASSLKETSLQVKKLLNVRKKILSAVAYPLTILVGTMGLILGLLVFVFPKIIPLFDSLKVTLPLSTRLLIGFSKLLSEHWLLIIVVLIATALVVVCIPKFFPRLQKVLENATMRVPILGTVIKTRVLSNLFDGLHVLLRGGEQLSSALIFTSETVKFSEYAKVLAVASQEVGQGKSLAVFLKNQGTLFPRHAYGILFAGERTGNIEGAVRDISQIAEEELEDKLKILTAALEPILMVSMSFVIGFIALSIILPIYGITSHFQGV